ncbi:MAG: hypothetical protein IPN38_16000 [Flavobacteriales bacterium]|nr:hypothetical protein [Flavobacteriales bacterium]
MEECLHSRDGHHLSGSLPLVLLWWKLRPVELGIRFNAMSWVFAGAADHPNGLPGGAN